jgi:hypothetical protein
MEARVGEQYSIKFFSRSISVPPPAFLSMKVPFTGIALL